MRLSSQTCDPQTESPAAQCAAGAAEEYQGPALRQGMLRGAAGGLGGRRLPLVGAPEGTAALVGAVDPKALWVDAGGAGRVAGDQSAPDGSRAARTEAQAAQAHL